MGADPSFAADPSTAAYYERRAPEYDEWYRSEGLFKARDRPGWEAELARLVDRLTGLAPARTLDVACGTAFLSRHLPGLVTGTDRSPSMVGIARRRLVAGGAFLGDALDLGVRGDTFDRVFTGHFYGHLPPGERYPFVAEVRRIAPELLVVDSAVRPRVAAEQWQERTLNDGSRHRVYKRYLTGPQLAGELGGTVLFEGDWFVAAAVRW